MLALRHIARKIVLVAVPVVTAFTLVTPQLAQAVTTASITESTPQVIDSAAIINYSVANLPAQPNVSTPNEYVFAKIDCLDGTTQQACNGSFSGMSQMTPMSNNLGGYSPPNFSGLMSNRWTYVTATTAAPFSATFSYDGIRTTQSSFNGSFYLNSVVKGQRYTVTMWLSSSTTGTPMVGTTSAQTFTAGAGAVSNVSMAPAGAAVTPTWNGNCILGCYYGGNYNFQVASGSKVTIRWTPGTANSVSYYGYSSTDPLTSPAPLKTYSATGYQVIVVPSWEAGATWATTGNSYIAAASDQTPAQILSNYQLYGAYSNYSPAVQAQTDGCGSDYYSRSSSSPQNGWYVDGISTSSVTLDNCHFAKDESYVALVQPVYMPASLVSEAKSLPNAPTSWNQTTGVFPMYMVYQLTNYGGSYNLDTLAGAFFLSAQSAATKADGVAGDLSPDLGSVTNVTAVPASTTDHLQKGTLKVSWTAPTRDLYFTDLSYNLLNTFNCNQSSPPYYVTSLCNSLGVYGRGGNYPRPFGASPTFTATAPTSYKVTAYRTDSTPWFGYLGWNGLVNLPSSVSCSAVAPATTCTLTGLATWTKYSVVVQARSANSGGFANWVAVDPTKAGYAVGSTIWPQAPSAPLNILASNPTTSSTEISWNTPTSVGGPAGVVISKYTAAMVPKFVPVTQTNKWTYSLYNGYSATGAYGIPSPTNGYGGSAFQLEALNGSNNLVAFTSWSCGTNPNKTKIDATKSPVGFAGTPFNFYGNPSGGNNGYYSLDSTVRDGSTGTCYQVFNSKGLVYTYHVLDLLNNSSIVDQTKYTVGTVSWIHHEQWGYVFQVQAVRTSGTTGDMVKLVTAYAPAYPTTDTINTTTGDIPGGPNFAAAVALKSETIGDNPVSGTYNITPATAFFDGNTNSTVSDAHMLNASTVLMLAATSSTVGTPTSNIYAATLSNGTWTLGTSSVLTIGCYNNPSSLCTDFATLKGTGRLPQPVATFAVNPVSGNIYFTIPWNTQGSCGYNYSYNGYLRATATGTGGTISYATPTTLPTNSIPYYYGCWGGYNPNMTYQAYYSQPLNFDANGKAFPMGSTALYSEDATAGFVMVTGSALPLESYDWWPTPRWLGGLGCRYWCGGTSSAVRTPGGQAFAITSRWSGDPRTPSTWNQTTSVLSVMLDTNTHQCTTTGALSCTVSGTVQGAAYGITVFATNKEPGGLTKDGPAGDFVNMVAGLPNGPTFVSASLTPGSGGLSSFSSTVTFTPSKKAGGVIDTSIAKYSCVMYDVSGTQVLPTPGTTIDTTAPAGATATTPLTCDFTGLTYGSMYYIAITATSPEGVSYPTTSQLIVSGASAPVAGKYDLSQTPPVLTYTPTASGSTKVTFYTANPTVTNGAIAATAATGITCTDTSTGCTPTGLLPGTTYYALVCTKNALDTTADATTYANLYNVTNGVPNNCVVEPFITPTDPAPDAVSGSSNPTDGGLVVTWKTPAANGTTITGYSFSIARNAYPTPVPVTVFTGCTGLTAASTTCTLGGLTNGTSYIITIYTNYTSKGRAYSATTTPVSLSTGQIYGTPMVPLAAPTNAPTAVAGNGNATVTWQLLTPPTGYVIGGYTIVASPGTGLYCSTTATNTSCVVNGLTNGTTYTFTLIASYQNTNVNPPNGAYGSTLPSPVSNAVTPQADPPGAAPANVTATAGNGSATISFDPVTADGGSPITEYVVTASPGGKTCTATAPATTCTISGLTNGTGYTFTVVAKNAKGTGPASTPTSSITPQAVKPQPPTNVLVTVKSSTSLTAKWTAPTDNGGSAITGYTATATDGTNTFTCTAVAPATTCDFTGLTAGTSYTVSVVATNAKGDSDPANAASAVAPSAAPSQITAPTATVGSTSATVTWTAPADNGAPITKYTVTAAPGGKTCTVSAPFPDPLQCTVTGLTIGTKYTFTVTATNGTGTSTASGASNQITGASAPAGLAAPTVTAPANNNSNTQLTVSWKAPTAANGTISQYVVTATPGGASCTVTAPFTTLSCTITGLTNGTAYTFKVVATNEIGDSAASPASAAATPSTLPGAATGVTGTAKVASVLVSWTAPTDNGGAAITKYTVTSSPGGKTCTTTGALSCTVAGLANGTDYTFTVVATNLNGNAVASDASTATSPAPLPDAPTISTVARTALNQVTITFTRPADPAGAPLTGYTVTAAPGGKTCVVTDPSVLTCDITGLTAGTSYTFTVVATNRIGNSPASKASAAITATEAPGAPTAVTASVDPMHKTVDQQAYVSWKAPTATGGLAIKGYLVTANPGGATCVAMAPALNCVVKGLNNGTAYTFSVVAINDPTFSATATTNQKFVSAASADSNSFTPTWSNQVAAALVLTPPTGPTAGSPVSALYEMPVTVNFSPTPPATSYTIKLNGVTVGTVQASSCTATACTFTWTPANKYILRLSDVVTVVSSNGLSISIDPAAPKALAVAELHYGSGLSTVGAGSAEANFLDQVAQLVKDNGYLNVSFVGYTDDDGAAAANLALSTTRATNASNYLKSALAKLGVTNVALTAVGKGISTTYGTGCAVNGATDACKKNRRVMVIVSGQQSAPNNVVAPTVTARNNDVAVSWTAPVANGSPITSYDVYYTTADDFTTNGAPLTTNVVDLGNWTLFCHVTVTNCKVASPATVTNGTSYVFFVVATNAKGTSQVNNVSASVTPAVVAADAPSVAVSAITKTGLTITVTAPAIDGGSAITGYTYTVLAGAVVAKTGSITAGTPLVVTGLKAGTAYTVSVIATNGIGNSPAGTKAATTLK